MLCVASAWGPWIAVSAGWRPNADRPLFGRSLPLEWPLPPPGNWPPTKAEVYEDRWFAESRWIERSEGFDDQNIWHSRRVMGVWAFGTPMRCLARGGYSPGPNQGVRFGEWTVNLPGIADPVELPIRPLWPGFLINTAFFAVCAWTLTIPLNVVRLMRKSGRRRRGQCVKCGYNVRSTGGPICPECGTSAQGAGSEESPATSG